MYVVIQLLFPPQAVDTLGSILAVFRVTTSLSNSIKNNLLKQTMASSHPHCDWWWFAIFYCAHEMRGGRCTSDDHAKRLAYYPWTWASQLHGPVTFNLFNWQVLFRRPRRAIGLLSLNQKRWHQMVPSELEDADAVGMRAIVIWQSANIMTSQPGRRTEMLTEKRKMWALVVAS